MVMFMLRVSLNMIATDYHNRVCFTTSSLMAVFQMSVGLQVALLAVVLHIMPGVGPWAISKWVELWFHVKIKLFLKNFSVLF